MSLLFEKEVNLEIVSSLLQRNDYKHSRKDLDYREQQLHIY